MITFANHAKPRAPKTFRKCPGCGTVLPARTLKPGRALVPWAINTSERRCPKCDFQGKTSEFTLTDEPRKE